MIDFYLSDTPNGQKMRLFVEESSIPCRIIPVSLSKGEQFKPDFLAISPNNKIPAMVDRDPVDGGEPIALFESGAMLLYLADKIGRFIPQDLRGRLEVTKWLFWQMAGLGPMAGQIGHFNIYAPEKVPYAIDRYSREVSRLYGVLDRQLEGREYIGGAYSIADMACYPWIVPHKSHGQDLASFPNVLRWFETVRARPATARAFKDAEDSYSPTQAPLSDEERRILFGQGARTS